MTTETSIPMVFPAGTSSETKKGKGAVSVQCSEQEESTLAEISKGFLVTFITFLVFQLQHRGGQGKQTNEYRKITAFPY